MTIISSKLTATPQDFAFIWSTDKASFVKTLAYCCITHQAREHLLNPFYCIFKVSNGGHFLRHSWLEEEKKFKHFQFFFFSFENVEKKYNPNRNEYIGLMCWHQEKSLIMTWHSGCCGWKREMKKKKTKEKTHWLALLVSLLYLSPHIEWHSLFRTNKDNWKSRQVFIRARENERMKCDSSEASN